MTQPRPTSKDLKHAAWFKSSRSGSGNECVEVALDTPGWAGVRDSKKPAGPALVVPASAFSRLIGYVTNK
jgi:hypothetical protein